MNKKLMAAAVGAALVAAPAFSAQAAVKVSGKIEVELVNVNFDSDAMEDLTQQGDDNGMSRLVFDASEDLGNGLKAIGRLAFQYDPSNNDGEKNRDQWVGLKGGFGAFLAGRLATPYKMYGGVKWDPFVATFLQARRSGGMSGDATGHNSFVDDVLAYATPKMGGFDATVAYIADENDATGVGDGTWTVGARWKGGPIEVIGAALHLENADADQAKVGVRYKSGGLKAFVQYEDVDVGGSVRANGNTLVGQLGEGSFLLVGAGYKFGNNSIDGQVGGFDADGSGSDVDYFALGLTHFFSKKTRVYAGYASTDVDGGEAADMLGAGIRFDF
jgi:predicted porin